MAKNQIGIAIVIKAFLETGKDMEKQYEALTLIKQAHETGDYSKVLAASAVDEVKTESKTRRRGGSTVDEAKLDIEDYLPEDHPSAAGNEPVVVPAAVFDTGDEIPAPVEDDVPAFLRRGAAS